MSPASTMKLVTTYAALELLGPAYTWETALYADAVPQDGVLDGNLYLQGSGDPALTLERFWLLLRDLRMAGLREIRGDLVLDDSRFMPASGDPGAFDARHRPYNAAGSGAGQFQNHPLPLVVEPDGQRCASSPTRAAPVAIVMVRAVAGACDWRDLFRHGGG
jgi:D-alanyl-D-alanine carboxypeptidase/D-alanyl-D-alanine-endopeptidase (penicillin-binding protein 4)